MPLKNLLLRKLSTIPKVAEYSSKVSSYIPLLTYDQHVHYERHLKFSRLRHLLIIPLLAWVIVYFTFPKIPNDAKLPPNVSSVYTIERFLFFGYLPHQLLLKIHNPFLDILCAIPYTLHIANPFIFILLCLTVFKQRITVFPYLHCLGALNVMGVFIQWVFPTAPPWYYDLYGVAPASYSMTGNPAGLARVDAFFGTDFYNGMFSASTIVFGAFPSLHVGWAFLICLFVLSWDGWKKTKYFMKFYVALLCFAVVYLQHHYVIDVLGGLFLAWLAKKIVPMPPLSTSMVITTTATTTGPYPVVTTTTTEIPLRTMASDVREYNNSPVISPMIASLRRSSMSTQTARSPALSSKKYSPFRLSGPSPLMTSQQILTPCPGSPHLIQGHIPHFVITSTPLVVPSPRISSEIYPSPLSLSGSDPRQLLLEQRLDDMEDIPLNSSGDTTEYKL